jgi:hypothetical protein
VKITKKNTFDRDAGEHAIVTALSARTPEHIDKLPIFAIVHLSRTGHSSERRIPTMREREREIARKRKRQAETLKLKRKTAIAAAAAKKGK